MLARIGQVTTKIIRFYYVLKLSIQLTVSVWGYDYVVYRVSWMLGKVRSSVLIGTRTDTL